MRGRGIVTAEDSEKQSLSRYRDSSLCTREPLDTLVHL